jgi:cupin-like protein
MSAALLEFNREQLRAQFNKRPFHVKHRLTDHPLFELPRLMELARALPPDCIEYNSGELQTNQDPKLTPMNGLSITDTIARIRENKSWMVMKFVEKDAPYRELLHTMLAPVLEATSDLAPNPDRLFGFIFISSPRAVTPYHMDPEHNFLLQIRGTKTMHVWSPDDRYVLPEIQLERFYAKHPHRNMKYDPTFESSAYKLRMEPGDGIHVPVTSPHHVKVDDEVSISFSVTFRSSVSLKRSFIARTHCRLREKGFSPPAVGRYPAYESALYGLSRLWRGVRGVSDEG